MAHLLIPGPERAVGLGDSKADVRQAHSCYVCLKGMCDFLSFSRALDSGGR